MKSHKPRDESNSEHASEKKVDMQDNNAESSNKSKNNKKKRKNKTISENEKSNDTSVTELHDNEETVPPKKKSKKKKKPEVADSSVPESQMSKRQLKREKHAQRLADAEEASHKAVQMQALSYLSLWKYNKAEWKFSKVKQIWLYKNKFQNDKIPDELWQPYIEYFSAAAGGVKKMIIDDCQKVIQETESWMEKSDENKAKVTKPSDVGYQRARDLLQNIN